MYKEELEKCKFYSSVLDWSTAIKDEDKTICEKIEDPNCKKSQEKT